MEFRQPRADCEEIRGDGDEGPADTRLRTVWTVVRRPSQPFCAAWSAAFPAGAAPAKRFSVIVGTAKRRSARTMNWPHVRRIRT